MLKKSHPMINYFKSKFIHIKNNAKASRILMFQAKMPASGDTENQMIFAQPLLEHVLVWPVGKYMYI